MTVQSILQWIEIALSDTDADRAEPYWLLCRILNCKRNQLQPKLVLTDEQCQDVREVVTKRQQGLALDYILGYTNFYGLDIQVDSSVLIPRMETELLCEDAIRYILSKCSDTCSKVVRVLDLCTGSGCIASAVAVNCAQVNMELIAADISPLALGIARSNMKRLIGESCNWSVVESDLLDNISGKFDLIVSNPPYIERDVLPTLSVEVRNQPLIALDGGVDGLSCYVRIANQAKLHMHSGARLMLEIGYNQAKSVVEILTQTGWCNIVVKQDYGGCDRIVLADWY